MHRFKTILFVCLVTSSTINNAPAQNNKELIAKYRAAAMKSGDASKGKSVFESKEASCKKCHALSSKERMAGPDLAVIGDKYDRDQLIRSVLEPSARMHPDYGTLSVVTTEGKQITGVLRKRTNKELQLIDAEGKPRTIPASDIEQERTVKTSLMPSDLFKSISTEQFSDLIAYLSTLKQEVDGGLPGMPAEIPMIAKPIRLEPLYSKDIRFDHPVWTIAVPGTKRTQLVVEQKTRKVWRMEKGDGKDKKELFVDLSNEASTGQFEGVMCLAFHPKFLENRKYYVNYHVRNQGSFFSPIIAERRATKDYRKDAGGSSKRLMQIPQDTDLHWGGMLAFGPDGYLYIGAGDAGPQEDPEGHGQNMKLWTGSILRIDVNKASDGRAYSIPETNPFRDAKGVLPEIWASGLRMPGRFSWDSKT